MDNNKFIEKCKTIIIEKENKKVYGPLKDNFLVSANDVFVVWSCKTLQNNKAILSATVNGAPMYEITHNGDKGEIYIDTYVKESNECIRLG
jgi:hypothetical protein